MNINNLSSDARDSIYGTLTCSPSTMSFTDLVQEDIPYIQEREAPLSHQYREGMTLAPISTDIVDILLPENFEELHDTLFPLHRQIESQYRALPWPAQMQEIVIVTDVVGGRGDIAAAAKAIAVMQEISPTLRFDWIHNSILDAKSFLNCQDSSKVQIRGWLSKPSENIPGDLLLVGPVKFKWGVNYVESRIFRKISGPVFGFMEIAEKDSKFYFLESSIKEACSETDLCKAYQKIHPLIFLNESDNSIGLLPMGLQPGSGVLLDQGRIAAPLSRGYCCPSYLLQIENVELRRDILESMNIFDGQSEPDYDQFSFNSGYAHWQTSWGKFIDCVAIHEHNKHVVIVLNQRGEFAHLTTEEFERQIFTPERLALLKRKGYGTVILKGEGPRATLLQQAEGERRLIVIVRPSFVPADMKRMQLASERLLATGDNSAVESWCARCKLYLYEDVANMGCKWRFLQQQVDLAKTISPNLSKLLAIFGADERLEDLKTNRPLSMERFAEMEGLLNDPDLSDATLQFCDQISANYSFDEVLEGALKRTAWHHYIPELGRIEAGALEEEFRVGLVSHLKDPKISPKTFTIQTLPELGRRVQEVVTEYKNQSYLQGAGEKSSI